MTENSIQSPEQEKMMISGKEVVEQLRKALRSEITVHPVVKDATWAKVWHGTVQFMFGDWLITVFNNSDHLDYIDFVISPSGREVEYADWMDDNGDSTPDDPMDQLSPDEITALENLLRAAN